MALTIGHLLLKLSASTASFSKDLDKAKQLAFGNAKELERSFALIGKAAAGAGLAVGAAFLAMLKDSIALADKLHDLSQVTGVSVEFLDRLRQIGKKSGAEIEDLGTGLRFLSRSMVDAQKQGSEQAVAFQALGIAATDARGRLKSVEEVTQEVIKAIGGMADGTAKVEIATRLLGKAGASLIPTFNEAAKSLEKTKAVISGDFAKKADELNDKWDELTETLRRFAIQAALSAADTVKSWTSGGTVILQTGKAAETAGISMEQAFEIGRKRAKAFTADVVLAKGAVKELKATAGVGILDIGSLGIPGRQTGERPTLFRADELAAKRMLEGMQQLRSNGIMPAVESLAQMREEAMRIWEDTRTPQERFTLQMARLNELVQSGALDWETYQRAAKQALASLGQHVSVAQQLKDITKQWADVSAGALANWIVNGGSFRRVLAGILADIAAMILKMLILRAIMSVFGFFGFEEGGVIPGAARGALIPHRQFGGGTPFAQGPFLVGERGAELFVPPLSGGRILSHEDSMRAIAGMGGHSGVTIINNVDNRGADFGTQVKTAQALDKLNLEQYHRLVTDRQSRIA